MPLHLTSNDKNASNGVASLNASNRITVGVDSADDIILNTNDKGIVLKDAVGTYWRVSVSTLGVLTLANLGTTKP